MRLHVGVCQKGLKLNPTAGFSIMTMLWVTECSVKLFMAKQNLLLGWNIPHIFDLAV
jgi:hypothetical protein